MSYLVFARKWRPQVFEEVIGQEHITTTLKNALKSGRIAHAYLFTGPRGIGKTSTARILAKALNCEKGPTPTPCNKCTSCKEITNSISLDVLEIDGASNTSVDQIRDLRENVKLSPSSGKFKVYIIDEVHMLSTSAFNALLKTLEEPPPHVKFIFATTQAHKVLPTIISRCQRFDFRRIPMQDIILKLKKISKQEKIDIDEEALFNIACASDGSMRDAESILDQLISYKKGKIKSSDVTSLLGMVEAEVYFDFSKKIVHRDTAGILKLINHIILEGKDLHQFMSGLIEHFRNLIILKVAEDLKPLVYQTQENIKRLLELSKNFSQQDLLYSFSVLVATQQMMRQSPNMRIPLEVAAVKLTHISQLKSLPQILEEIKNLNQNGGTSNDFETQILNSEENKKPLPKPISEAKKKEREKDIIQPITPQELTKDKDPLGSPLEEEINSQWPAFLENIKNESLLVGLYLSESKILKIEGNHLFIGFHNEGNFHIDYLQKRENKNLIEKKLTELMERKIKVSFVKLEEKAKEPPQNKKAEDKKTSPVDSIIDSAIKIFGGRIIRNR
jgi:DNA polymerase-3 subunit gamma/tau